MVGGKRQESVRDIINLFSNTYNVDNDFDQNLLCEVGNILESNQSSLPNVQGMPNCSSNLTDNTRNKEIGCSTKNYVQDIDDHYEQNLLFQTENLLQNNEVKDIDLCINFTVLKAAHLNKNGD